MSQVGSGGTEATLASMALLHGFDRQVRPLFVEPEHNIASVRTLDYGAKMTRFVSMFSAVGACAWLACCSAQVGPNWGDQVTYHAAFAASHYQQQFKAVIAKILLPDATAEEIEVSIAKPLEKSVGKLSGVKSVTTVSSHGSFLMEVEYDRPAGDEQLAEVRQVIDGFWRGRPASDERPSVTLEESLPRSHWPVLERAPEDRKASR